MKKAWIEDGRIRDIAHSNPSAIYHAEVAKFYDTDVPDEAVNGQGWTGTSLIPIPVPELLAPPAPPPRQWTIDNFRTGMTLAEKTKWDNDSAPEIKTVKAELPKELAGATELLDFLVGSSLISVETKAKILA
jgi:hypothetical protein